MRDSKGVCRDVRSLFVRQGASICDERVQAKIAASTDPGQVVRNHLLNPFDCLNGNDSNCVGECRGIPVTEGVKKELQEMKKRLKEKLDL